MIFLSRSKNRDRKYSLHFFFFLVLLSETDGLVPSEPIFIPRRHNFSMSKVKYAEDDGVVMSVVVDMNGSFCVCGSRSCVYSCSSSLRFPDAVAKSSFLMLVDGSTFVEIARVMAPCVINFGLHNYWFEDETVRLKLLARI